MGRWSPGRRGVVPPPPGPRPTALRRGRSVPCAGAPRRRRTGRVGVV